MNAVRATAASGAPTMRRQLRAAVRSTIAAWRGLTLTRCLVVTAVALLFVVLYSASSDRPSLIDSLQPRWAASLLLTAWITLLGLAVAENNDHGTSMQPWRYLPLGIAASVAGPVLAALLFEAAAWLAASFGAGASLRAPLLGRSRIAAAVFENLVLVNGALFVYVYLRNADRLARMAAGAELRSAQLRGRIVAHELATAQALVDPAFLLGTLGRVEQLYQGRPAAGEALMDALIGYLRAALPLLEDERSPLGEQGALAHAYLRIEQSRLDGRLAFDFDIPPEAAATRLPPLLLPLVGWTVRRRIEPSPAGGTVRISARRVDRHMTIEVEDNVADQGGSVPRQDELDDLRARLATMFGDRAQLELAGNAAGGITVRLELPHG